MEYMELAWYIQSWLRVISHLQVLWPHNIAWLSSPSIFKGQHKVQSMAGPNHPIVCFSVHTEQQERRVASYWSTSYYRKTAGPTHWTIRLHTLTACCCTYSFPARAQTGTSHRPSVQIVAACWFCCDGRPIYFSTFPRSSPVLNSEEP
jgi:hypothetical protein